MIILLSPAKTLDLEAKPVTKKFTEPEFLNDSKELIGELKVISPQEISSLMKVSDKIGALNAARFGQWHTPFTPDNAKQAVLMFKGDVYQGLAAETFKATEFTFAQKHLRILSGLYGLLRPLDLMQPYRLEMGTPFANGRGKNLYEFWGSTLTDNINKALEKQKSALLINLASNEYYKAIQPKDIEGEIISPVFKDYKNGQYKIISFYAKKARGLMAQWLIKNRITDSETLLGFDEAGYMYNESMSKPGQPVFIRDLQT